MMKSLNKNWFLITMTAVVFGLLGYLLGNQNSQKGPRMMEGPRGLHMEHMKGSDIIMFESDGAMMLGEDGNIDIEIDTLLSGGEQRIKVIVKKEIK